MKIVNIDNKKSIDSIDNKKSTRKMKDEYGGTPVIEFVSPKPKSYTLIDVNNYEKSTHEGHSYNFKSSEFKDVINNKKVFRHTIKKIVSKNQKIYTQESNKISLSCFDDKRYIKDDGIHTLAHGHKDIPKMNKKNIFSLIYNNAICRYY